MYMIKCILYTYKNNVHCHLYVYYNILYCVHFTCIHHYTYYIICIYSISIIGSYRRNAQHKNIQPTSKYIIINVDKTLYSRSSNGRYILLLLLLCVSVLRLNYPTDDPPQARARLYLTCNRNRGESGTHTHTHLTS